MNLFRREIKFQISLDQAEDIQDYLNTYCQLDYHSKIQPSHYYIINTLYLDSPTMYLLEQKRNDRVRRFSMRIRSYGEEPEFPAYLEKKKRIDSFIHKTRVAIKNEDYIKVLEGSKSMYNVCEERDFSGYSSSCFDITSLGLSPKIMTRYHRKAYFGIYDNYSRVTFDKNLRYYGENDFNIFPNNDRFRNYDHQDQYLDRDKNIILELKCEPKVPLWMSLLIQKFRLRQKQFSKFDSSWTYYKSTPEDYVHGF